MKLVLDSISTFNLGYSLTETQGLLTSRDLDILRLVESLRLLTSEQIQALVPGSDQNNVRSVQVLSHAGYLDRLAPRRTPNGGSHKMIYAVTDKGAHGLWKEGLIQKLSKTDLNAQNRNLHDLSIRDRLLVSHIRSMLTSPLPTRHVLTSNSFSGAKARKSKTKLR